MPSDDYMDAFIEELHATFVPNTGRYNFGNNNGICKFNNNIECKDVPQTCGKCGWNPAVAELRTQDIRRRLGLGKNKD